MPKKTDLADKRETVRPWGPSTTVEALRRRAEIVQQIRGYFERANVLEVDTPVLMTHGSPDPAINNFVVEPHAEVPDRLFGFLQTSPEFAMKRLLAAGSGDIFQLCHAFRAEAPGRHHLAEFTLLEWYRWGFDHHQLMDEVERFVDGILPGLTFARRSYADLFYAGTGLDPHAATNTALAAQAGRSNIELGGSSNDRSTLLDALFAHVILRDGGSTTATFVYDFPIEHSAYARIDPGPPAVAQRFELLVSGIEVANGYFEVVDAEEQTARHHLENARRRNLDLPEIEPDPRFLNALKAGPLPSCAGVALGVDRLVMLCLQAGSVAAVVSFDAFGPNE